MTIQSKSQRELVERDVELHTLRPLITGLGESGPGRLVVVQGPAGIGKSRLLAAIRESATVAGHQVLSARGSELESGFALGGVRQLLERSVTGLTAAQRDSVLTGAAAKAADLFGPVPSGGEHPGDFAVLHSLYWLVVNLARIRPVVMTIDDLQWLDAPSLRFVIYLSQRVDDIPIVIAGAHRTGDAGDNERLVATLLSATSPTVLTPRPLSKSGTQALLTQEVGSALPVEFIQECHSITGGNPLLLAELVRALNWEQLGPAGENVAQIKTLGAAAVAPLVTMRLGRLPGDATAAARAAAILGDGARLDHVAQLACLSTTSAVEALDSLHANGILRPMPDGLTVEFVHPLIQSAVYDSINVAGRIAGHAAASDLLANAGHEAQEIAAHLLHTPAHGAPGVVDRLIRAADEALSLGSPDAAVNYLRRTLQESLAPELRMRILSMAGMSALYLNLEESADYFAEAIDMSGDDEQRIELAISLGRTRFLTGRSDEALAVWRDALRALPPDAESQRRRLECGLLNIALAEPDLVDILASADRLRALPPDDSVGARALDCVIGLHDAFAGDPGGIEYARRGLAEDILVEQSNGDSTLVCGWLTLLANEDPLGMASIDAALSCAYRTGSVNAMAPAHTFRSLGWLWQGHLAEAEADARESAKAVDLANVVVGRPFTAPFLAEALIEQGRLDEALAAMAWAGLPEPPPMVGPLYFYLHTRAHLLRLTGAVERALEAHLASGEQFTRYGGVNPSFVPWRSEAALCLSQLGSVAEARGYALAEVEMARQWGAPRALGRALRITGVVQPATGMSYLEEAVSVLASSNATLEHAKACLEFGAALRRSNHRQDAREHLRVALELAEHCGADSLARRAGTELRASGGRGRSSAVAGVHALTPSEFRAAELASSGQSNREIAQALFVTTKTIEVHLGNAYRKLGITSRHQLAEFFAEPHSVRSSQLV